MGGGEGIGGEGEVSLIAKHAEQLPRRNEFAGAAKPPPQTPLSPFRGHAAPRKGFVAQLPHFPYLPIGL